MAEQHPKAEQQSSAGKRREAEVAIASAIANGDYEQALELCTEHYSEVLGRICMSLIGSQAEAEVLVQDTLLDAVHSLAAQHFEGSPRTWLIAIARRKCVKHLGSSPRLRVAQVSSAEGAPDLVTLYERAHRVRSALLQIQPSERDALILRYLGDLSYRDLARVSGVDELTARERASCGLTSLRRVLEAEERT